MKVDKAKILEGFIEHILGLPDDDSGDEKEVQAESPLEEMEMDEDGEPIKAGIEVLKIEKPKKKLMEC